MSNPSGHGWYTANATREYPLDDAATGTDDADQELAFGVIVDARIRFPRSLGQRLHLSGLTSSRLLVTAVFAVTGDDGITRAAGVVSVSGRPVVGRPYPVMPIAPGVGGWVVFGPEAAAPAVHRFGTESQSVLAARAAAPYADWPVTGVGKNWAKGRLAGLVNLVAGADVEILAADREIEGRTVRACVIRLIRNTTVNLADKYRGPCGGRPESGTCNRPALEFLGTVGPDCAGDLALVFAPPITATPFAAGGGIALSFPYDLSNACGTTNLPDAEGRFPDEPVDDCNPVSEVDPDAGLAPGEADTRSEASLPGFSTSSGLPIDCTELPACVDFSAPGWLVVTGAFSPQILAAVPAGPCATPDPQTGFVTDAPEGPAVALWYDCGYSSTLNKRATLDLYLPTDSEAAGRKAGGVVVNHRPTAGHNWDEYFFVDVDALAARFRIRRWTGTAMAPVTTSGPISVVLGGWYRIVVEVTPGPTDTQTRIAASLYRLPGMTLVSALTVDTTRLLPATGRFGVGREPGSATFASFLLEGI